MVRTGALPGIVAVNQTQTVDGPCRGRRLSHAGGGHQYRHCHPHSGTFSLQVHTSGAQKKEQELLLEESELDVLLTGLYAACSVNCSSDVVILRTETVSFHQYRRAGFAASFGKRDHNKPPWRTDSILVPEECQTSKTLFVLSFRSVLLLILKCFIERERGSSPSEE